MTEKGRPILGKNIYWGLLCARLNCEGNVVKIRNPVLKYCTVQLGIEKYAVNFLKPGRV